MSVKDSDSHKLMYHPERVAQWNKEGYCPPIHAEIGITNRCNHKCSYCTLDWITHGDSSISYERMKTLVHELSNVGVRSIYLAGEGEPTLHPHLADIVKEAHIAGLKTSISTNGSNLTKELSEKILPYISWIRVSLDSVDPDTHAALHRVSPKEISKIIKNIEECIKIRNDNKYPVEIGAQALLTPETLLSIRNTAFIAKHIGMDNFQVKPAHSHPKSSYHAGLYQFSHDEIEQQLLPLESYDFKVVVRKKSIERLSEPRNYKYCYGFYFYVLIDANGNVTPCNVFYGNPEFIYGNINDSSFCDIWGSQKRVDIIEKIAKTNFCHCGDYRCRLDVINRYLDRVKNKEKNDDFI